jgi:hypothetical protein
MVPMSMFAAQEWHFWIAPLLAVGGVGLVLKIAVGYFLKVVLPRYQRR